MPSPADIIAAEALRLAEREIPDIAKWIASELTGGRAAEEILIQLRALYLTREEIAIAQETLKFGDPSNPR